MASPALPNTEPRPRTVSPAARMPRVRPAVTPQKLSVMDPNTKRSSSAMVHAASAANTTVAANRVQTSRRSASTSAIAGSRPARVMGSAEAASPTPRGSSGGGAARSSVRSGIPDCSAMPPAIWVSSWATAGLPPVAISRVGGPAPMDSPPYTSRSRIAARRAASSSKARTSNASGACSASRAVIWAVTGGGAATPIGRSRGADREAGHANAIAMIAIATVRTTTIPVARTAAGGSWRRMVDRSFGGADWVVMAGLFSSHVEFRWLQRSPAGPGFQQALKSVTVGYAFTCVFVPERGSETGPPPGRTGLPGDGAGGRQTAVRAGRLREDDPARDRPGCARRRVDGVVPVRLQGRAVPGVAGADPGSGDAGRRDDRGRRGRRHPDGARVPADLGVTRHRPDDPGDAAVRDLQRGCAGGLPLVPARVPADRGVRGARRWGAGEAACRAGGHRPGGHRHVALHHAGAAAGGA